MKLLAKFKVGSVVNYGNKNVEANLTAVQGDSPENKTFSMYTPRADAKLHITNPDALDFFEAGEEYIAEFTKVVIETPHRKFRYDGRDLGINELCKVLLDDDYSDLLELKKGESIHFDFNGQQKIITRVI